MRSSFFVCLLSLAAASACGAATPEAEAPEAIEAAPAENKSANKPAREVSSTDTDTDDGADPDADAEKPKAATPEFKPGMTVEQAISAVPDGVPRLNMEQETLAAPLQNPELYAPCKPSAAQHFKLRLAVWNGRVVGLDVAVTPKSATLENCLREQLGKLEWKDRVESLNTIDYAF